MAGKSIIPFVGSESTYGLNGEPSPANQALASPVVEEEAMQISTTPLAFMPVSGKKVVPRGAKEGAADTLVRLNQGGGPSASPLARRTVKEVQCPEGQGRVPWDYAEADDGRTSPKGHRRSPRR